MMNIKSVSTRQNVLRTKTFSVKQHITPTRTQSQTCASKYGTYVYKDPYTVCKNCKYFRKNKINAEDAEYPEDNYCTHTKSTSFDIVSGNVFFESAYTMRSEDELCGLNAKHFEKEHEYILFLREHIVTKKNMNYMQFFTKAIVYFTIILIIFRLIVGIIFFIF